MAHVNHLSLVALMSSQGVKGNNMSWESHERDRHFGETECTNIGKIQRLRNKRNTRIHKVSVMRAGLAKIMEKVCISTYYESAETDLDIVENACCIDYADTRTLKQIHQLSKSQSPDHCTTHYGCQDTLEHNSGFAQERLRMV
jgi:hypothetical protein